MAQQRFKKTPDQQKALLLLTGDQGNILLFGGSRSGKSFILIYALIVRALRAPGSRHLVLRLHTNSIRSSIWADTMPKVLRLAFPGVHYTKNISELQLNFANGSEICCAGLDSGDRTDKILGREFATVYFNECSEMSYQAVAVALTRLAQKTALKCKAYYDCNPPGKSHWSYKLFVQKTEPETGNALLFPDNYASMVMNPGGNAANLPDKYIQNTLAGLSEIQRMRFLEGRWLEDREGALWQQGNITANRVVTVPPLYRIVVGVDPAVSSGGNSDLTGIVTCGMSREGHYYVLADASCRGTVGVWVERVVREYRRFSADRVAGEVNNGGELVEFALRHAEGDIPFLPVRASRGKITRAEPVAALYEQGLVHHAGVFAELEEEMTGYTGKESEKSPDRMDALVWAITCLAHGYGDRKFRAFMA